MTEKVSFSGLDQRVGNPLATTLTRLAPNRIPQG